MKPRLGAGLSLFRSIAAPRGAETGGGAILLEIYPTLRENLKFPFAKRRALDSTGQRIRDGFMDKLTVLRGDAEKVARLLRRRIGQFPRHLA